MNGRNVKTPEWVENKLTRMGVIRRNENERKNRETRLGVIKRRIYEEWSNEMDGNRWKLKEEKNSSEEEQTGITLKRKKERKIETGCESKYLRSTWQ